MIDLSLKGLNDSKLDVNGTAVNAQKVNSLTVQTAVPAGAVFTDTVTTVNGKTGAIQKSDILALGLNDISTSITNGNIKVNGTETTIYTHPSTHAATMITGLATVATSGSYTDLSNKPNVALLNGATFTGNVYVPGLNVGSTLTGASIVEIGSSSSAYTAGIDLHSSGTGSDFDVRIASNGGSATSGQGNLSITASTVSLSGSLTVSTDVTTSSGAFILSANSNTGGGYFRLGNGTWGGSGPAASNINATTGLQYSGGSGSQLFTFSGYNGQVSLQTDGSIFVGDSIGYNPYGVQGSSTGYLVVQNGGSFGDNLFVNGGWLYLSNDDNKGIKMIDSSGLSKSLRCQGNQFQVINNAYNAVIYSLDDSGNSSCVGTFTASKVYNAVYNDYAEYFLKDDQTLEPGDVIIINPDGDGYIKSRFAYDDGVVGVYSDDYAQCIGGDKVDDQSKNEAKYASVGLAGRVRVKVTGTVKKNQLLVASDIPGVAMAQTNYQPGTVIGKALENHDSNQVDRILMLVINC